MIGIDLGTTNSLVSVWEETGVRLLKNRFGESMTPSVVSFDEDGTIYVGNTAKERLITHPDVTFREFKRDMGTETRYVAYGHVYTPEELSALVLKQLREDAEFELGHPVEEAVISVPAYFDDRQRAATRNAGRLAGLKVDRLINEPSAAALFYHMDHYHEDEMFIVFDFGGGTLDVSLVDAFDNIIEIQAIAGNNRLGGKDFNELIARDFCARNGLLWDGISRQTRERLLREAEKIKMMLTDAEQAAIRVRIEEKEYSYELDNQRMIDFSGKIFAEIQKLLTRLMNDGMTSVDGISKVIMVGGSSRMPVVRQFLSRLFQGKIGGSGNPDEIVCQGAGVLCGIRQRKDGVRDVVLSDICPFTLGTEVKNGLMSPIIFRNQILPCSCSQLYTTVEDYQTQILCSVYQGENRRASDNLLLEKITFMIPPKPKGEVVMAVRFSYDINGLFDVDINCLDSGEHIHRELSSPGRMTEDELRERKAALEKMKIPPREEERNKCLLEQANALYVECNKQQREILASAMYRFEKALDGGSAVTIEKAWRQFTVQMAMLKKSMFSFHTFDRQEWDQMFEDDDDTGEE